MAERDILQEMSLERKAGRAMAAMIKAGQRPLVVDRRHECPSNLATSMGAPSALGGGGTMKEQGGRNAPKPRFSVFMAGIVMVSELEVTFSEMTQDGSSPQACCPISVKWTAVKWTAVTTPDPFTHCASLSLHSDPSCLTHLTAGHRRNSHVHPIVNPRTCE